MCTRTQREGAPGLLEVGGCGGSWGPCVMSPPCQGSRGSRSDSRCCPGCQAGLRPHWTHPALAEMKDLTSHPIRNQAAVVEERKAPEARSSRAGSLLCYRLTGGAQG